MGGIGFNLPLPFIIFATLMLVFTSMVKLSELQEETPFSGCGSSFNPFANSTAYGCVKDFGGIVIEIVTFDIGGAPWFIRVPFSIIMALPIIWIIVAIAEGVIP